MEELAGLPSTAERVLVVENEVSLLALPPVAGALAVWGGGNRAPETLGAVGWLRRVDVCYWGDLDTHGFAILDRLRSVIPGVRSLLMDRATLLEHQDRWGQETGPTRRDLPRLTDEEALVYGGLCGDTWGERIRLEQELVGYGAVERALSALGWELQTDAW